MQLCLCRLGIGAYCFECVINADVINSRSLFRSGDVQGGLESLQRAVAQYKLAGDWDSAALTLSR